VCENFGRSFRLPELGPIGANGLASRRDFEIPEARFEERSGNFELFAKFGGQIFRAPLEHSPFDVVAWHGTLAPFRYDLFKFNAMGSITFDHPDPSIFTVLTSPSEIVGTANMDFVAFAPRWLVMEHSFRPPYYHRNIMSEFMGLVQGEYDAKIGGDFVKGASSLHNCMSGHGPDAATFEKASSAPLQPQKLENTMAFMFESRFIWQTTDWALKTHLAQINYRDCWKKLPKLFQG
jgi:homogentisate 1,2-dioxygenase